MQKQEQTAKNILNLSNLETVFCTVCFIDIPIRAKHCKICKKCVTTFDHHCSWVGNCVGEKNKLLFLIFLFFHVIELSLTIIKVNYF